MSFKAKRT